MAVLQPKPISRELQTHIDRAVETNAFIVATVPDKFTGDSDEKILVASMFSLVLEHHAAILHLLGTGQFDGSALALVRPLIESAYRAHWVYSCASADNISRIRGSENVYPGLINMATEIEKKVGTDGFFLMIGPYINSLHGYTHGGLEQLGRRFDASGNIRPNYSEGVKTEIINATTAHLTALAIAWCQLATDHKSADDPNANAISDFYYKRYGAPSTQETIPVTG